MVRSPLLVLMLGTVCLQGVGAQTRFTSKEPGNVFYDTQPVRFALSDSKDKVHVRIVSVLNKTVREGDYSERDINLGKLPWGWYRLVRGAGNTEEGTPFAVVPRPRQKEEGWAGVTIGLFSLQAEQIETVSELARRAGFVWARSSRSWSELEPIKGKFLWERADKAVQAQNSKGLRLLQVISDVPKWARADSNPLAFPDDLRDAFRSGREFARHFGGVRAWEVGSEADNRAVCTEPASEYAAYLKAFSLGIKSGNGNAQVVQTSLAHESPLFAERLAENGTAAYYDVFSFHSAEAPNTFRKRIAGYKKPREKAEAQDKPVWLTEARFATSDGVEQAKAAIKSYVESRRAGVARHFYYSLADPMFGVLDRELLPLPAYASLATVANFLGNASYKGEIRYRQPGLHIHVFDDGSNDILVAWTERDELLLPLPLTDEARGKLRFAELIDAFGSPLPLSSDKDKTPTLPLSTLPILLALPRGIMTDVTIPSQEPTKKTESPKKAAEPSEIVVRVRPIEGKPSKSEEAYRVPTGRGVVLEIEVYNFGGNRSELTLRLSSEAGGVRLVRTALPIERLKEMERLTFKVEMTLDAGTSRGSITALVTSANGEKSSPAVLDVVG